MDPHRPRRRAPPVSGAGRVCEAGPQRFGGCAAAGAVPRGPAGLMETDLSPLGVFIFRFPHTKRAIYGGPKDTG